MFSVCRDGVADAESAENPGIRATGISVSRFAEEPLIMNIYIVFGGLLFCISLSYCPDGSPT